MQNKYNQTGGQLFGYIATTAARREIHTYGSMANPLWDNFFGGIVYPVTLPIALHPNPIGKKLKLLLSCDPM